MRRMHFNARQQRGIKGLARGEITVRHHIGGNTERFGQRQPPGVGLVADDGGNAHAKFVLPVFFLCAAGNGGHVGAAA